MKRLVGSIIILSLAILFVSAQDTLYIYKAGVVIKKHAVNNIDSITFKYNAPLTGTITDIDGNIYHWITIGTQTWMVENLKTTKFCSGESISNITDATLWGTATFAAYCDYNNDLNNSNNYGRLYNWYAVNDSRKIAPIGWHIPSDTEWIVLENYLISIGANYDGTTTGSKIAKSLASTTSDWPSSSNTGSIGNNLLLNNRSGFTALPGHWRTDYGSFFFGASSGSWWSSTEFISTSAWNRTLDCSSISLTKSSDWNKKCGLSVRCIKN